MVPSMTMGKMVVTRPVYVAITTRTHVEACSSSAPKSLLHIVCRNTILCPRVSRRKASGSCEVCFSVCKFCAYAAWFYLYPGFYRIMSHSRPLPCMAAECSFILVSTHPIHQTHGHQTFKLCHPIAGLEFHFFPTGRYLGATPLFHCTGIPCVNWSGTSCDTE